MNDSGASTFRLLPLVAGLVLLGAAVPGSAQLIPAPSGAPAPSVILSADHGAPGSTITVSGLAPLGSPSTGVRVQWLLSTATEPAVEVALAGGAYLAEVTVPDGAAAGPALLCAGVTDAAPAELACASFTVDEPALGTIIGTLPRGVDRGLATASGGAAATGAVLAVGNPFAATTLSLTTSTGTIVATTTPSASGAFSFTVPPGNYTMIQGGAGPKGVAPAGASVRAGGVAKIEPKGVALSLDCLSRGTAVNINGVEAFPAAPAAGAHFGTYFSGVPAMVTFKVQSAGVWIGFREIGSAPPPDPGSTFEGYEYEFRGPSGQLIDRVRTGTEDFAEFDVGRLPPGISTVTPYPIADGVRCVPKGLATFRRTIRVLANPITSGFARADSSLEWVPRGPLDGYYRTRLVVPNIPGLPLYMPDPPISDIAGIPIPIVIDNHFDANASVDARIGLNGDVTFRAAGGEVEATFLSVPIFSESFAVAPPGAAQVNFNDPRTFAFTIGKEKVVSILEEFLIYEGSIFDLFGIIQLYAALTVGFDGGVDLFATLYPLQPNVRLTMLPQVAARGAVSIGLGLVNIVQGGARLNTRIGILVPIVINASPPDAHVNDPCGFFQATMELFVRIGFGPITLYRISTPSYPLVKPNGMPLYFPECDLNTGLEAGLALLSLQVPQALPPGLDPNVIDDDPPPFGTVNPAPVVAVSDAGERMRVHVEDATLGTDTITTRLVSQTWNPATQDWGPAQPITDGTHWVGEPSLSWAGAGAGRFAVVAWSARPTTLAEDQAVGDDIGGLMKRHEIYVATFASGVWSAPLRLTSDLLPDGSASVSGDATGYTVAWNYDADGNPATRTDARVKVREVPIAGGALTTTLPGTAMNVDPSVVRRGGVSTIAYTEDPIADGLNDTYRTIRLARGSGGAFAVDGSADLPRMADSPSLAITGDGRQWVSFLVRGLDDDGVHRVGDLSTRARVRVATRPGASGSWEISDLAGGVDFGETDRGESPTVVAAGDEARLVYRSFGQPGTGAFGQLMSARLEAGSSVHLFTQITSGAKQRWLPAAAIDPVTGDLTVVSLDLPGLTPAPDDYAVVTTTVRRVADPALVELQFDPPYSEPGANVVVGALVTNLGLAEATAITVDLLDGPPGTGNVIDSYPLGDVRFGDTTRAPFEITAVAGRQTVHARVRTSGGNARSDNDVASADLRSLSAPDNVRVAAAGPGALAVSWLQAGVPVDEEAPSAVGYRVERSDAPGGARELAGEATTTAFRDALLLPGQAYCYVVTAYDATGVVSPPSAEACSDPQEQPFSQGVALAGTSLRIASNPVRPGASAFNLVSKDGALGFALVAGSVTDPVLHGAKLRLGTSFGDSFEGLYDLPAANWKYLKKRGVTTGFKYVDRSRTSTIGPVKTVVVNLGKDLKASGRGAAVVASLRGDPGPLYAQLEVGPLSYCMQFGGTTRYAVGKSFSARKAPPPRSCPVRAG